MTSALNLRRVSVVFFDMLAVSAAYLLAFLLRFDLSLDADNLAIIKATLPFVLLAYYASARVFALYRGIYYYSSFSDLLNITKAAGSGAVLGALAILFARQGKFPRSVLLLHPILSFLGVCGVRFAMRLVKSRMRLRPFSGGPARTALLIGAGDLGESLLRQMLKTRKPHYKVVGFIDDDPGKWGMRVHGYSVLGGRGALASILSRHEVDEIIISISARRAEIIRSVMEALSGLDPRPELKIAPSLDEMLKAPHEAFAIREVKPADLLNRDVVRLDQARIGRAIEGKTVLVSGAGGTIGGELCRQALGYKPAKLILIENHATSLFYREAELKEKNGGVEIVSALGDIRDQGLVERVFKEHRPQIVLHAAAHKHVYQLEFNLQEGVANNILGTYHLAGAAAKFGAEAFLLVSTDKAVNPSCVMGATKRGAEYVVKSFTKPGKTRFMGVRFGNVLGSSGSVLKIFQDQIAEGGPVTVTDPLVTRYFMTVEEAVGLILQAVAMGKGGEIFILKMGTPVRIMDMARNLIRLSGLEPGKDIDIRVTGLKQGEKLDEELVEDPAGVVKSEHPDIMVLRHTAGGVDDLEKRILEMEILSRGLDAGALLRKLVEFVPTFRPAEALLRRPADGAGAAAPASPAA